MIVPLEPTAGFASPHAMTQAVAAEIIGPAPKPASKLCVAAMR
ncbi:hypothetical protein BN77_p270022 [Rhizobium mesoamericanum STM3625]|uniref:Uncharacterized protein n=1 Tax=Rhizobium mesoamericanum STM3625 TaxID=1211777 RepID=K0Q1N4_9HYPH|nr:hypothetical protein BN77_p270022 [Rhizobium mesoamericanum STM3625]